MVGNWKLNKTCSEARALIAELAAHPAVNRKDIRCIVAPPATALWAAAATLGESHLAVCAQNIHATDAGAFTGEISAPLAQEAGAQYVLVGHSERRQLFYESDADTAAKLIAAARAGLTPILCIGETAQERQQQRTAEVVERQLRAACTAYLNQRLGALTVAYEPVWAIGSGVTAAAEDAQAVHRVVRKIITELAAGVPAMVPLLYGGSVTAANAAAFAAQKDIDGVLVGGASLRAESFVSIIEAISHPM